VDVVAAHAIRNTLSISNLLVDRGPVGGQTISYDHGRRPEGDRRLTEAPGLSLDHEHGGSIRLWRANCWWRGRCWRGRQVVLVQSEAGKSRRPILAPDSRGIGHHRCESSRASRSAPAGRKHSGSAAVRRFAQRLPQYPTGASANPQVGPFPNDISKIPCKFPANSLLPQKKFPARHSKIPCSVPC
jgi:hypothetical protein